MLERTWTFGGKALFRAEKLYTAQNYKNFISVFKKNFPDYVYYCPFRRKDLISSPINTIDQVFVPRDCLATLSKVQKPDGLQALALDLLNLLSNKSQISMRELGIHGSIALNMHSPLSDIDFVVYGSQNFRTLEKTIAHLVDDGKMSYVFGNRLEAARRFQGRYKAKVFMYNATRKRDKIKKKYGEQQFSPIRPVKLECKVDDDSETMFRPAIYHISDYRPKDADSKLPNDKLPTQVVSNIGCYRNIAKKGSIIRVSGVLEKVEPIGKGEAFHQVVVGTATAEEEYIWPV